MFQQSIPQTKFTSCKEACICMCSLKLPFGYFLTAFNRVMYTAESCTLLWTRLLTHIAGLKSWCM